MSSILDLLRKKNPNLSLDDARSAMSMEPGTNFNALGEFVPAKEEENFRQNFPSNGVQDPNVAIPTKPMLMGPLAKEVPQEPQMLADDYFPEDALDIERNQAHLKPESAPVKNEQKQVKPKSEDNSNYNAEQEIAIEDLKNQNEVAPESKKEQAPVVSEKKKSDLHDRFKAAQEAKASSEDAAMWSKIGARLGGAIAKASPGVVKGNEELADMIASRGGRQMQQLQEDMAFQAKDPDSDYSRSAREFLKQKFNVDIPEGVSIEQLNGTMMKPLLENFKQQSMMQKVILQQQEANNRNELTNATRRELGEKNLSQRALQHKDTLAMMGKKIGLQEQGLGDRNVRALNSNLQQVSQQLNNPNNRYNQQINRADNMFATVGIDPNVDVNKLNDKDLTKELDQQGRTLVIETAMEGAALLTGGKPAVSTLEKLIPNNINNKKAYIEDFLNGKLNPAQQAPFLKAMLKVAHRVKEQNKTYLQKQAKESLEPLKEMVESTKNPALKQRYDEMVGYHKKSTELPKENKQEINEDAQAIQWAKENPNDPDAQEILKLHGM